ncbi:hypothetical protein [Pantoea sp. BAV 3049]|uniref:hypothetical protein n=1 Tax=Pantoea sp. BAV 3049 TaxID=2654188 RepID=UPI00131CB147|nr:hypothetical protein [Pantoea sp. BAV 3049]
MRVISSVLVISIGMLSLPASAAQMYKCSLTQNRDMPGQKPKVDVLNHNSMVTDNGNTFTFSTDGVKKITSPELIAMKTDDGTEVMAGKQKDLTFVKLKNSYVIRNAHEGYVYAGCKPAANE